MSPSSLQSEVEFPLYRNLSREVVEALAKAGQALVELANALGGQTLANPAHSLSPSPLITALPRQVSGLSLVDLSNEFLRAKARAGRSDRYLAALRNSLSKFTHGRGRLPIEEVSRAMVEAWLDQSKWAARTQQGYSSDLQTMFNWAVRKNYLAKNPLAGLELPEDTSGRDPVIIHTPAEVAAVLEFARARDLNVCRALAVRYFAGLRSAETGRLTEANIGATHIEVTARAAKTRQRRPVEIRPNLRAWLELGGELPVGDWNNKSRFFTAALRKARGIAWPHNVTRHSFCSYHLASSGSAARTALEAGHSEQMLFKHYRAIVTPEAAAAFWAIVPK